MTLNLVDVSMRGTVQGGMALFWSLTSLGKTEMLRLRSVKKTEIT
jgi:hypothetical protein